MNWERNEAESGKVRGGNEAVRVRGSKSVERKNESEKMKVRRKGRARVR